MVGSCPTVPGLESPEIPDAAWNSYEWIVWSEDGPDYRLRIGVDREGQPTGIIEGVEGEWTSEPEDQCQERLSSPWVKLTPWVYPRPCPCSPGAASGWATIPSPGGVVSRHTAMSRFLSDLDNQNGASA